MTYIVQGLHHIYTSYKAFVGPKQNQDTNPLTRLFITKTT